MIVRFLIVVLIALGAANTYFFVANPNALSAASAVFCLGMAAFNAWSMDHA